MLFINPYRSPYSITTIKNSTNYVAQNNTIDTPITNTKYSEGSTKKTTILNTIEQSKRMRQRAFDYLAEAARYEQIFFDAKEEMKEEAKKIPLDVTVTDYINRQNIPEGQTSSVNLHKYLDKMIKSDDINSVESLFSTKKLKVSAKIKEQNQQSQDKTIKRIQTEQEHKQEIDYQEILESNKEIIEKNKQVIKNTNKKIKEVQEEMKKAF